MNFKGRKIQTFMICLIHFSTSDRDSRYMWAIDPIVTSNQSCRFRTRRFGFNLQPNRSIERWLHIFKKVVKETHPVKKTEFNVVKLTYFSGNFSFNGMLFSLIFFLLEIWGKVLRKKKKIELSFCTLHPGDVINSNMVEIVEKLLPHKSATAIAWSLALYFVF